LDLATCEGAATIGLELIRDDPDSTSCSWLSAAERWPAAWATPCAASRVVAHEESRYPFGNSRRSLLIGCHMVEARKEFDCSALEYTLKRCEEFGRDEGGTPLAAKQKDPGGDRPITLYGPIVEGDLLLVFGNTSFEQWFHLPPVAPTDRETKD